MIYMGISEALLAAWHSVW